MNLTIDNSMIIINKRLLKDQKFNNLFCNSVFNLFSFEIDKPRILFNCENKNLKQIYKKLKKNCEICFKNIKNLKTFCKCVHFCEFDLGIFVDENCEEVKLKMISGSGESLSQTKISVIEKCFNDFSNLKSVGLNTFKVFNPTSKKFSNKINENQLEKLKNFCE